MRVSGDWLAEVTAAATPIWPYIAGGLCAIFMAVIGAWRMFQNWRVGVEAEAERKANNTQALQENTETSRKNTEAIGALTTRLAGFEAKFDHFADQTDTRMREQGEKIAAIERKQSRPAPRRRSTGNT